MPDRKMKEPHRPLYLKEVLVYLGVSQAELARRLGRKHHTEVSDWCRGPYYPSWKTMIAIADALDVSLDTLAGRRCLDPHEMVYRVTGSHAPTTSSAVESD